MHLRALYMYIVYTCNPFQWLCDVVHYQLDYQDGCEKRPLTYVSGPRPDISRVYITHVTMHA
jgi:hypothetical protein